MPLTIQTSFLVAHAPASVWPALVDIETSAPCFPGAQLQDQLPDGSYKGLFTVKLGPMIFTFNGKFRILQQDDAARTALMEADGTDSKGRGGAKAQVQITLSEANDSGSNVSVVSDVTLSGSVAQYGRGVAMIEALSKQLLEQFSRNLSARITSTAAAVPELAAPLVTGAKATSATAASRPVPVHTEPAAPLDAGALVRNALWLGIKRFFTRVFGTPQRP